MRAVTILQLRSIIREVTEVLQDAEVPSDERTVLEDTVRSCERLINAYTRVPGQERFPL